MPFIIPADINGKIASADKVVNTFEGAVTNIERNRSRFPHVDDRELQARKDAVSQLRSQFLNAKAIVNGRRAIAKMDADRKAVSVLGKASCVSAGGGPTRDRLVVL